jgi:hypothetical protein
MRVPGCGKPKWDANVGGTKCGNVITIATDPKKTPRVILFASRSKGHDSMSLPQREICLYVGL